MNTKQTYMKYASYNEMEALKVAARDTRSSAKAQTLRLKWREK